MSHALRTPVIPKSEKVARIERLGGGFLRYGLTVAIGWIAAMKATDYEAKGIEPLIAHSPLLHWGYSIWTVDHFTMIIGAVEMTLAILIALRRWFPLASAVGSAGAVIMFVTTLSFIITTAGWEPSLGGFPALSGDVGEFLIKDLVLLGAALWTIGRFVECCFEPAQVLAGPVQRRRLRCCLGCIGSMDLKDICEHSRLSR